MTDTIPLGELIAIRGGGTPSRSIPAYWNGEIPWATVKDFKSTELAETEESITPDGVNDSATNIIPAGSVIVPTRMAVGKAAINTIDLAINQDLKALLPGSEVDSRFLLHFMLAQSQHLESQAQGATVKGIKLDLLRALPFPRISRSEQHRLATILDKADAIRRKREQALTLADDFLQSVFLETFGDPVTNPKGFRECRLDEIADIASGLTKGRKTKEDEKLFSIPYMRVANVQDGYLDLSEIKLIGATSAEIERYALAEGDLLLTEGGDPDKLGRGSVWSNEIKNCIHQNHIFRVRLRTNDIHPIILQHQVGSVRGKSYFLRAAKQTTGIASINKRQLSAYPALIPDQKLQIRYLELIKRFGSTRTKLNTAANEARSLFAALSQRAFSGDL